MTNSDHAFANLIIRESIASEEDAVICVLQAAASMSEWARSRAGEALTWIAEDRDSGFLKSSARNWVPRGK